MLHVCVRTCVIPILLCRDPWTQLCWRVTRVCIRAFPAHEERCTCVGYRDAYMACVLRVRMHGSLQRKHSVCVHGARDWDIFPILVDNETVSWFS